MKNQNESAENLHRCPHFESCSQNLCPLDYELYLRAGKEQDKCRWMRKERTTRIQNKIFKTGGSIMPDAILNFVPEGNLKWLNETSQKRWQELVKPNKIMTTEKQIKENKENSKLGGEELYNDSGENA